MTKPDDYLFPRDRIATVVQAAYDVLDPIPSQLSRRPWMPNIQLTRGLRNLIADEFGRRGYLVQPHRLVERGYSR